MTDDDITPCPSCFCMTHSVKKRGSFVCGKCGADKREKRTAEELFNDWCEEHPKLPLTYKPHIKDAFLAGFHLGQNTN